MIAAGIEDGRLLRSVSKSGKVNRDTLSDWAIWSVVEQSSKQAVRKCVHFLEPSIWQRQRPTRQQIPVQTTGSLNQS
jgi:hypothetical protein